MGINSRYPDSINTASSQQQETETAKGDPSGSLTVEQLVSILYSKKKSFIVY